MADVTQRTQCYEIVQFGFATLIYWFDVVDVKLRISPSPA